MIHSSPCTMWAFIEHIGNSKKIRIGRNHEKKFKLKGKINTLGVQTLPSQRKRGLAHHDTAVADECRWRQRLGEGICDHFMCAQRDEFDKTSLDEFAHEIIADINVRRKISVHWIFTHGNTGQIILIDFSCILLTVTFPRNRSAIHHKNIASVRAARISVANPIYVNAAPEFIGVSGVTSVCNRLIPSVTQILQNMFSRLQWSK